MGTEYRAGKFHTRYAVLGTQYCLSIGIGRRFVKDEPSPWRP